jgi:hypothetical protein
MMVHRILARFSSIYLKDRVEGFQRLLHIEAASRKFPSLRRGILGCCGLCRLGEGCGGVEAGRVG